MKLTFPTDTPIRQELSTQDRWLAPDDGLIACWERGRELAETDPELSKAAMAGELIPLPWKGGVGKRIKTKPKYGALRYLAMWQGLRKEALNVDTGIEQEICCTRFGVTVTFTKETAKYENG